MGPSPAAKAPAPSASMDLCSASGPRTANRSRICSVNCGLAKTTFVRHSITAAMSHVPLQESLRSLSAKRQRWNSRLSFLPCSSPAPRTLLINSVRDFTKASRLGVPPGPNALRYCGAESVVAISGPSSSTAPASRHRFGRSCNGDVSIPS
jgi:hypothetical protein